MNNREKFLSVLSYEPDAVIPIMHFGYWDDTIIKWKNEGHISENDDWDSVSKKLGFDCGYDCFVGATSLFPAFEVKVIKEFPDGSRHILNSEGVIELRKQGITCIPAEIGHTLTNRESWEREYLPRLKFSENRYDFNMLKQYANGGDYPLGLYTGSLYGCIRNWFGIVELSYLAVEDEELYDEVINTVAALVYDVTKFGLEKAASMGINFDYCHFWEDICFCTGPLVNPSVFAEKVGPWYKKITDVGKQYGVRVFSLDCDGLIDLLLPVWLENGVNTMFPIEVGTWNASIAPWRKKYGTDLLGVGGMDKRVFAGERSSVDTEIERLKPLVALGGYIPCPDHRIAPDAKWDNVRYYCDKMHVTFC